MIIRRFFQWVQDIFHIRATKKALDAAESELRILRDALEDIGDELEHACEHIKAQDQVIRQLQEQLASQRQST